MWVYSLDCICHFPPFLPGPLQAGKFLRGRRQRSTHGWWIHTQTLQNLPQVSLLNSVFLCTVSIFPQVRCQQLAHGQWIHFKICQGCDQREKSLPVSVAGDEKSHCQCLLPVTREKSLPVSVASDEKSHCQCLLPVTRKVIASVCCQWREKSLPVSVASASARHNVWCCLVFTLNTNYIWLSLHHLMLSASNWTDASLETKRSQWINRGSVCTDCCKPCFPMVINQSLTHTLPCCHL